MKVNYPSEEQINSILQSYWQGAGIGSKDLINMTINLIKQLNPEQNLCNCNRCLGVPEEPEDK